MKSRAHDEETTQADTNAATEQPQPPVPHPASLEDRVAKLEAMMARVAALVGE